MRLRVIARVGAAVAVVTAVSLMGSPTDAHHSIDFDSHNCDTATPSPDVEPDLTPPPTEPPSDPPPGEDESTPAPQNCMPAEGERIWGTRLIKFSTTTDNARTIRRVALYIESQEEEIPAANGGEPLLEENYSRDDAVSVYDTPFSWNSREVTPYNGTYKIRVEVDTYQPFSNDLHRAVRERVDLRVDNAPVSVAAPAIIATTPNSVTMNWVPGVEPDILSYTVYRATTKDATPPPYSAFKSIGATAGAGFRDTKVTPGVHWYSVKVTRRSVITPDTGISSALSPISAAAEVKSPKQEEVDDGEDVRRPIRFVDNVQHRPTSRLAAVADAPFAYKLPYDPDRAVPGSAPEGSSSEGGSDPRGPVLPVAVGMFLVSSALAVGRMPY